jgi:hypothetical protein
MNYDKMYGMKYVTLLRGFWNSLYASHHMINTSIYLLHHMTLAIRAGKMRRIPSPAGKLPYSQV